METLILQVNLKDGLLATKGHSIHLDALLARILVDRGLSIEEAHESIPLARHDVVWQGSQGILQGPVSYTNHTQTGSLKLGLKMTSENVKPKTHNKNGAVFGNHKNYENSFTNYKIVTTPAVYFTGKGDLSTIKSLMSEIVTIGPLGKVGFGRIDSVELLETDFEFAGFVDKNGRAIRSIPQDIYDDLYKKGMPIDPDRQVSTSRVKPPYWTGEEYISIIPNKDQLIYDETELEDSLW